MQGLLYLGIFICHLVGVLSRLKYGYSIKTVIDICVYAVVTGVIALMVFAVSSGFNLQFNFKTVIYAIFYSLVVIASYSCSLIIFKFISVSESGFYSTGLTLVITAICGYLLFSEPFTLISVIRVVLMLISLLLIYLTERKTNKNDNGDNNALKPKVNKNKIIGILLCVAAGFVGVGELIISKLFAIDSEVTSSNSLFFLTNVITIIIAIIVFLIVKKGNVKECFYEIKKIKPILYLIIIIATVASNIIALLNVLILKTGSVSLFAPLSNALLLLAYQVVGAIFKKEKIQVLPSVLAVVAIILGIWG